MREQGARRGASATTPRMVRAELRSVRGPSGLVIAARRRS